MKPGRHRRDACSGVSPARTHNKPTRTRTSQVHRRDAPFLFTAERPAARGPGARHHCHCARAVAASRRPPHPLGSRRDRRRLPSMRAATRTSTSVCTRIGFGAAMRRALREFGLDDFVREKAASGAQRRPRGQTPGISLTNNALAPAERQGPPAKVALALYVAIRVGPFGQGSSRRGQAIVSRSAARRTQLLACVCRHLPLLAYRHTLVLAGPSFFEALASSQRSELTSDGRTHAAQPARRAHRSLCRLAS